jgi:hypothetical protein
MIAAAARVAERLESLEAAPRSNEVGKRVRATDANGIVMGDTGLEPVTSALSRQRSPS